MRTPKELIKDELIRVLPPPKGMTEQQVRVYWRKIDLAASRILRAISRYVDFCDEGGENGHG